jgi:LysR family transcriptional regulator, regulator of abg operon
MKTHQLRALTVLAEHGSMRAAAQLLHVTQPAISQAIRELEEQAGTQLVARSASGVVLTEAGQLLLQHARRVVREIELAQSALATHLGRQDGQLSIGVTPLAAPLLQRAIVPFRKLRPQTRLGFFEYRHSRMLEQIRDGALDFGVVTFSGERREPDIAYTPLFTFQHVLAVRAGHPLAACGDIAALAGAEWLYNGTQEEFDESVGVLFRARGLAVPATVTLCTSMLLYWGLAAGSDAVSVWTSAAVLIGSRGKPALAQVPVQVDMPPVTLGFVARRDYVLPPAAETLRWAIEQEARRAPPNFDSFVWSEAGMR